MDRLKKLRGGVKARFTRLENFLALHQDPEHNTKPDIQVRIDILGQAWSEYEDLHKQIIDLADEAAQEPEERDFGAMEEKYIALRIKLLTMFDPAE
jgi:hypothetical protein